MSFIGGCFCKDRCENEERIRQKLQSFPILLDDDPQEYDNLIAAGPNGFICSKFKPHPPKQVQCAQNEHFAILTLGFHDVCSKDLLIHANTIPNCGSSFEDLGMQIEKSQGEFVSLLMNKDSGDIKIINDRFAARPFYISQSGARIMFSSNLFFLLSIGKTSLQPDPLGWLQIFSYGHTLSTRTNHRNIIKVRPATHITVSNKGLQERQYWKLKHVPVDNLDPETYADEVFTAFKESAASRSQLVNKGFVSLSGGLDSRLVAAAIPEMADFFFFTISDSVDSHETRQLKTARQVAQILGREHKIIQIPPSEASDVAGNIIRLTAGLVPVHHPVKTFQSIKEMKASSGFKMGGGPGGVLAGSSVSTSPYNLSPKMTGQQVYKFLIRHKRHSITSLAAIFRRDLLDEYYKQLDLSMQECFENLSGPTAAHRITAWGMVFRQPAFTFTSPIHNHPDVAEASPHLGYKYTDLMLQLPASWLLDRNFYKFMIWYCLPKLRNVIYANTGNLLPSQLSNSNLSNKRKIAIIVESKLPPKMLERFRMSRRKPNPNPGTSFEYDILRRDKKLFSDINEIIHSKSGLNEIIDPKKCIAYVDGFRNGRLLTLTYANEAELMGALATMCYWYKTAVGVSG
jgi:Asparagine synthase